MIYKGRSFLQHIVKIYIKSFVFVYKYIAPAVDLEPRFRVH